MVVDSIKRIREQGGRVVILGPQIKGYEKAADVADGFIFLRQRFVPVYVDPDNRPRRYSLPWASIVARNLTRKATQKPAKRVLGASTLWWIAAKHNRQALALLDGADVITALDAARCTSSGRPRGATATLQPSTASAPPWSTSAWPADPRVARLRPVPRGTGGSVCGDVCRVSR